MLKHKTTYLAKLCSIVMLTLLLTSPLPASAQDFTTGLIGHWKLDETSGTTAVDSSGYGNNAALFNGVSFSNDSIAAPVNTGLQLDNTNDVLQINNDPIFNITAEVSMAAWIVNSGNTYDRITGKSGGVGDYLFSTFNSAICFIFLGGTNHCTTDTLDTTSWYHVATTFNDAADEIKLYINGELSRTISTTDQITAGTSNLEISSGSYNLHKVDDVRIYNRTLTDADVKALYEARSPGGIRYNDASKAIKYHNGYEWVHAGLGSYSPNAVTFDGTNDYLTRGSTLTGVVDGPSITYSAWFRRNSTGTEQSLFGNHNNHIKARFRTDNKLEIEMENPGGSNIVYMRTGTPITDSDWHHIMFSLDLSNVTASPTCDAYSECHLYIDGVDDAETGNGFLSNDDIGFVRSDHFIGAESGAGRRFDGDMADVWFDFNTYIDLSVAANREKFRSANGMPMYLGPDGSLPLAKTPDIFLSGDTANWHTNKGTGGGFTENGALTDTITFPADPLPTWAQVGNSFTAAGAERAIAKLTDSTIAYIEDTSDNLTTYSWDGTDWSQVGNALNLAVGTNNPAMTSLNSETIAIAEGSNNSLRTYSWDGTDWSQVGNTFSINTGTGSITALDESTIAFAVGGLNQLRTYSWDGTDWSQIGTGLNITGITRASLTTLTPTMVAFTDDSQRLETYSWDGSNWTKLGNTLTITGSGRPGIEALNSTTVAYADSTLDELRTYRWNGTDWIQIGTALNISGIGTPVFAKITPNVFAMSHNNAPAQIRTYRYAFCSSPAEPEGSILYNTDQKVMQYCNGVDWVPMGPVSGTGGNGCFDPSGNAGDIIFNTDYSVLQYCNDEDWVGVGTGTGTSTLSGLVGHWTLDETSGTTASDSSGNGNDGTLQGGMDAATDTVTGQVATALDFDGTNDRITIPDDASLKPAAITYMAWVSGDSFGNGGHPLDKQGGGPTGYGVWEDNGQIKPFIVVNGSFSGIDGPFLNTGQFYHIASTYDGTDHKLYIDGALYGTDNAPGTIDHTTNALSIGREDGSSCCEWDGKIDDVRIYNQALSAAQILEVYQSGKNFQLTDNLAAHWTLDETTGSSIADSAGSNTGTWADGTGDSVAEETTAGKVGTAITFDGTDDKISVGTPAALNGIFAGGATIATWVNLTANAGPRLIDRNQGGSNSGWLFGIDPGGQVRFDRIFSGNNGSWTSPASSVTTGQWFHVAVTYDEDSTSNDAVFYVNGVSAGTVTEINSPSGSASNDSSDVIVIGNRNASNRPVDGEMDDVRIYDRVLTAGEILTLYNATK